jgi:ribosomal subunit interface protein
MKIIIKTTNLKLNQALKNFIEEKVNSLEKFSKSKVEAWVEIGKTTLHHQKGPFFRAECQMRFPGKSLRATALSKDLRPAITEVKDELQRQLKQYKNKLTAQTRRKQRI